MSNPEEKSMFDVKLTIKASLLGPLMAFLDNKYETISIHLVKVIPNHRNLPKGSAKVRAIEILSEAEGHMETALFKAKLLELGMTKSGVSNFIYRQENKELFHRKGKHIWLKKGATVK